MKALLFGAVFASGLAFLPSAVSAAFPYSSNWAGYLASGNHTYSSIEGSWTIPSATGSPRASDAAWIGIGGARGSNDLIQTGTMAVISTSGKTTYLAWIEMLPHGLTGIPLKVAPGDTMQASIQNQGGNEWLISLKDATSGQSYSTTIDYHSSESSAEWIEERPTARTGLAALDSFGTVSFSNAYATVDDTRTSLQNLPATAITMIDYDHATLAKPSAVANDGFSVAESDAQTVASADSDENASAPSGAMPVYVIHLNRGRGYVREFIIRF